MVPPLLQQGDAAFARGDYTAAEAAFTQVIDEPPSSRYARRDAYLRRAKARLELGRGAEAAADADAALDIFADAEGYYLRGRAHRQAQAWELATEDLRRVIEAHDRKQRRTQLVAPGQAPSTVARVTPAEADLAYRSALALGEIALYQEQYQAAIDAFDTAATLAPDDPQVYLERGGAYRLMEMEGRAEQDLERYRRLGGDPAIGPEAVLAPLQLKAALAHYAAAEYQAALDSATRALALQPGYVAAHLCRGHSHTRLAQYEQALDEFNVAVQLAPEDLDAHLYRAFTLTELGQYDAADQEAAFVLARQPANPHALLQRGYAAMGKGRHGDAVDAFSQILEQEPGHDRALLFRGISLYKDGRLDGAEADFRALLQRHPNHARSLYLLGLCLYRRHDEQAALGVVERALEHDTRNSELYHLRGILHHNSGQLEAALKDFDQAVALAPGNPKLYLSRGVVNSGLGRTEAAAADYALARNPPAQPAVRGATAEETLQPETIPLQPD